MAVTRLALLWGGVSVGEVQPCLCQGCPPLLVSLPGGAMLLPGSFIFMNGSSKLLSDSIGNLVSFSLGLEMLCIKGENPVCVLL